MGVVVKLTNYFFSFLGPCWSCRCCWPCWSPWTLCKSRVKDSNHKTHSVRGIHNTVVWRVISLFRDPLELVETRVRLVRLVREAWRDTEDLQECRDPQDHL